MQLTLAHSTIRSWKRSDAASLVLNANNRNIWLNLRDRFPHPYTPADARLFLREAMSRDPETAFAIDVDGQAVGGIGFVPQLDVERISAEIGYWLGEPYWGRGIATEALTAITQYAIAQHGLTRIFALPFAWNAASCRVLEKAGYTIEARLRKSAIKDGRITDQMQYSYVVE